MANEQTANTERLPKKRRNLFKTNAGKTIIWIIGNAAFGLAPLLFMIFLNNLNPHAGGTEKIKDLLNDGLYLFVALALMGAVLIDILNDGIELTGIIKFVFDVSPFAILAMLLTEYILIVTGTLGHDFFATNTRVNDFIIFFSIVYCSFGKYFLYKSKGLKDE